MPMIYKYYDLEIKNDKRIITQGQYTDANRDCLFKVTIEKNTRLVSDERNPDDNQPETSRNVPRK